MTHSHKTTVGLFTFLMILTVGCATIFKGSSADVRFNSSPSNATIMVDEINKGTTPATVSLDRDRDYVITFKKDGYESVKVEVNKKFDLATTVVGNIFSWSLLGIVVDLASGAAYSLEPADVEGNLGELEAAGLVPDKKQKGVTVIMLSKSEWQQIKSAN